MPTDELLLRSLRTKGGSVSCTLWALPIPIGLTNMEGLGQPAEEGNGAGKEKYHERQATKGIKISEKAASSPDFLGFLNSFLVLLTPSPSPCYMTELLNILYYFQRSLIVCWDL